nr:TS-2 [Portieria hornemannii]
MPADPARLPAFDPAFAMEARTRIDMPVKYRLNPHEKEVRYSSLERVLHFGIIPDTQESRRKLLNYDFANLCSVFFPTISRHQLEVAVDLMYFFFVYDDICDNFDCVSDPTVEPYIRKIEGGFFEVLDGRDLSAGEEPFARLLCSILSRCKAFSHPGWYKRFCIAMRNYLEAVRWERKIRSSGEAATYNTYEKMRSLSAGVVPCFYFATTCLCKDSPENITNNAYLIELLRMATIHVQSVNDFFSMAKDIRDCTGDNIVVVLAKERELSWPEAIECSLDLINKEMKAFLSLESKLEDMMGPMDRDVVKVVESMKHLMRGNRDWCGSSGRYRDINSYVESSA